MPRACGPGLGPGVYDGDVPVPSSSRGLSIVALVVAAGGCASNPATPDAPSSAWQLGPAMPRPALHPGVALLGQQVVVAGGFDSAAGVTARVDGFDISDATWHALPDAPVQWTDINLAVAGATLYLAGGLDAAGVAHGESYQLDPIDQQWKPIAAIDPAEARGGAGVTTAMGRIYLLGGAGAGGPLASSVEYDLPADTWTPILPDLPVARVHPAVMRMVDGTLIVAGGFASLDASQPLADVWALAPPGAVDRAWQPRAAMPAGARGDCAYGVVLGELVCAGGQSGAGRDGIVASYNPYLDAWTPREAMPVARAGTQGTAAGGRLFVPGGSGSTALEPTDTLYIYTPLDTAARRP